MQNDRLFLHEEIMLLALRDKEGTTVAGSMYAFAIGGAVLAELLLSKAIGIEQSGKKKFVKILRGTSTDDPVLDEGLQKIKTAKRRATLQTWVSRFANLKNLKHRIATQLCRRGILRADEDKVLLIFTRKIYPEVDPGPEREVISRLQEAIFTTTRDIDPRTVILLSLAKSADLLRYVFDKKELKKQKARMEEIINGEATGTATKEAIEAMQAAVMVAAIMPAVITTTTSVSS